MNLNFCFIELINLAFMKICRSRSRNSKQRTKFGGLDDDSNNKSAAVQNMVIAVNW
jgi:hypothetical protein